MTGPVSRWEDFGLAPRPTLRRGPRRRDRRRSNPRFWIGKRVRVVVRTSALTVRVDERTRQRIEASCRLVIVGEVRGWQSDVGQPVMLDVGGYGMVPATAVRRVPGWWRR